MGSGKFAYQSFDLAVLSVQQCLSWTGGRFKSIPTGIVSCRRSCAPLVAEGNHGLCGVGNDSSHDISWLGVHFFPVGKCAKRSLLSQSFNVIL